MAKTEESSSESSNESSSSEKSENERKRESEKRRIKRKFKSLAEKLESAALEIDKTLQKQFNLLEAKFEKKFQDKLHDFEISKNRELDQLRRQKEKHDEELISVAKLRQELEEQKRINHPISSLTKRQLYHLLAALVSTLARIIADTIKTKIKRLENIASLQLENTKKRSQIRSYCEECKSSCPGDDFFYDGLCKKEYCKHRLQAHKTTLVIIEALLKLLQDTCIGFSLFRVDDKSNFPSILVEELSKISDKNEAAKTRARGISQAQKNFYCDFSIKLNAFTTTFQDQLVERSTHAEYIGSITNSTVIKRILQLMSLENGGEKIKARVEKYTEQASKPKHRKNETESDEEDEPKSNKSKKKRTQSTSEDSSPSSTGSSEEEKPNKTTDSSKKDKIHKKAKKSSKEELVSDHDATAEKVEEIEIINASLPPEINIVLLGGTGIGKSTFINAIANMLSHRNLDEAKMEVHVLIKTVFNFIESDTNINHKITMEPTIAIEKQGEPENESIKVGQSCTKLPRSYIFKYGRPGFERTLRIIDTPGIGDTNGVEQDRENIRHIINFVSSFREIHAFLFVLKPNDARLELQFRYCIKELLTHLHVSATENIIFCMTNGKDTNYKPGETFGTLQALLNTIKEERQVEIRLQERCLVFDNEFYRYLCEVQHNMKHTEMEIKNHHESWTRGKNELSKMMKMIANLTPHNVNNTLSVSNTLSVNKVRRAIEIMSKPLAELAKNLLINIGLIEEKQAELQKCLNKGEDLKNRLFTRQIQMNTEELDDPMTVCGHHECSKREPLYEGGVEEIIYGEPCHNKCYLQSIAPGEPPEEAIKSCEIFGSMLDEYTCNVCSHSYEDHLHMRYKLVREVTEVIDLEVQQAIVENHDRVTVANLFLANKRKEIQALKGNLDRKQTICAHFAIFLKNNSVLAYNDQYMAYMNDLIREERKRVQRGSSEETVNRLETCLFQYIELKKVFDNPTNGRKMTLIEIEDLIEEIKKMDDGDIIKDIHNLEIIYPTHLAFDSPPIPIKQNKIRGDYENKIKQIFKSKKGKK